MTDWEELGYESKEDYDDAFTDYIVHEEIENELQRDS